MVQVRYGSDCTGADAPYIALAGYSVALAGFGIDSFQPKSVFASELAGTAVNNAQPLVVLPVNVCRMKRFTAANTFDCSLRLPSACD